MASLAEVLRGAVSPESLAQLTNVITQDGYSQQVDTVTAAGAISVATFITKLSVTGTTAYTLANGTRLGQLKLVVCTAGASTPVGTITPATAVGFTTIAAIGAVGDLALLCWIGTGWVVLCQTGTTVS